LYANELNCRALPGSFLWGSGDRRLLAEIFDRRTFVANHAHAFALELRSTRKIGIAAIVMVLTAT